MMLYEMENFTFNAEDLISSLRTGDVFVQCVFNSVTLIKYFENLSGLVCIDCSMVNAELPVSTKISSCNTALINSDGTLNGKNEKYYMLSDEERKAIMMTLEFKNDYMKDFYTRELVRYAVHA